MKVRKLLALVLAFAMIMSTMSFTVFADDTDIIEVGSDSGYATFAEAVAAAKDDDGDGAITYHIYGKVDVNSSGWVSPRGNSGATTVNFVGMTEDAEISIVNSFAIIATDGVANMEAINYSNLTLSRPNGSWAGDVGFANVYFSTWTRGSYTTVTYTDCVFPNGSSNNQFGKTVYTNCEFNNDVEYCLWVYSADNAETVVTGSDFEGKKGVKIYSETPTAEAITSIENSTFAITSKPAVVSSLAGTLALNNVDASECEYGILTNEFWGHNPAYKLAEATIDGKAPEYVVSVNGELHTSLKYAQEENRGEIETIVASVNGVYYSTLQEAVDAADAGDIVKVLADINAEVNPTADSTNNDFNALIHTDKDDEITLDLNGKTIFVKGSDEAKYDTLAIRNNGNLTIEDSSANGTGRIVFDFDGTNEVGSSQIHSTILNFGTLTINGGSIENIASTGYSRYGVYNYSWGGNAILTINGGVISSDSTYAVIQAIYDDFSKNNNYVVINDGTLNGGLYSWYQGACLDSKVEINGGTLNAGATTEALRIRTSGSYALPVEISDAAVINGDSRIQAAAKAGGKYYGSLVPAMEVGGEVTLLSDVTFDKVLAYADRNSKTWNGSYSFDVRVTKEVVLDLNGKTIKSTGGSDSTHYAIICVDGKGDLTIVDSSAEKTGAIVNATTSRPAGKMSVVLYNEAGDIALNGGTYSNQARVDGNYPYVIDSITAGDTSLEITDGVKLVSDGFYVLRAMSQGGSGTQNVTISGGEFDGNIWAVLKNGVKDVMNISITDGTFNGTNAFIIENYANPADGATADSVNISGGTFNGKVAIGANNVANLLADGFITGGLFSTDVDAYAASGFGATKQYNGMYTVIDEDLIVEAIEVKFEDITAVDAEGEKIYNINLVATDDDIINRLNSSDLTFDLNVKDGNIAYEIIASNDEVEINPVYNPADGSVIEGRYEFHYAGKDGVVTDTDNTINIAKVKFTGYGKFDFVIDKNAGTNVAHATTLYDNIVESYVPGNDDDVVEDGELVITDNTINDIVIAVPTRKLVINVAFPNGIEANAKEYQDMKVTVEGPDNYKTVIDFGNGTSSENLQKAENGVVYYSTDDFNTADKEGLDLVLNTAYTVTLEGAGYRTVKYTVSMTESKTLNFWNNVKDNKVYVETSESGIEKYAQNVTFLAGDIVKDNNINVYDLSAVVSYFGEIDLAEDNKVEYAKYDLNRDGKIDSKDVAYVLVSWGN